jgi:hypothetical protein
MSINGGLQDLFRERVGEKEKGLSIAGGEWGEGEYSLQGSGK